MIDIDTRYRPCLLLADITDITDIAVGCIFPVKEVDRPTPSS
jgi:hypothetical protein